jgi:Leucine-rich repeat (LRR) protein
MRHLKTFKNKNSVTFKKWLEINNINSYYIDLDCSGSNLIDLDGIENFINLEYLDCENNFLTKLPDLSNLKKLERLNCSNNKLTELPDLSSLESLSYLDCENNKLTKLPDLSGLNKLKALYCYGNNLPYNNLREYMEWYKEEYPWIWDAKKYNI